MKLLKEIVPRALKIFCIMTLICGLLYTGAVTVLAQGFFNNKANGSIIEIDGVAYASELVGQKFKGEEYLWGRVMNDGNGPSNLSPASEEYKELIATRAEEMQKANPDKEGESVPVELVTSSGSGIDPHISPKAAAYQVPRLAKANDISEEEVEKIIEKHTEGKLFGILGEAVVNVVKVNLELAGVYDDGTKTRS